MQVDVLGPAHAPDTGLQLPGDLVVGVPVEPLDADVDGGGQAEVEDLAGDVGGLEVEAGVGESGRQPAAQLAHVVGRRRVLALLERHEDLAVRLPEGGAVSEGQVEGLGRHADVVHDQAHLAGRYNLADLLLDRGEQPLGLLQPGAGRSVDVQAELAGVHRWEEVTPHKGQQGRPGGDEQPEQHENSRPVIEGPLQAGDVMPPEPVEAAVEGMIKG